MFTNTLGETIIVEVRPTCEETTILLSRVMGNDTETASFLANEVHRNIQLKDVQTVQDIPNDFTLPLDDLGIWIDPIDATGEYVHPAVDEIKGLHCVTVLIGAYLKSTGLPVLGIVNKPFSELRTDQLWNGSCYWGYYETNSGKCCSSIIQNSINDTDDARKTILIGRSEGEDLKSKLKEAGFTLMEVTGAGHKVLSVALGMAAAYILSKGSTYKWDTCSSQAILRSLGGGIVDYQKFLENPDFDDLDLKYSTTSTNAANSGGLIAYRDVEILRTLKQVLS